MLHWGINRVVEESSSKISYQFIDDSENEDVINTAVENDSIFLKQDTVETENNGETSILNMPYNDRLSSTSTPLKD